MPPSNGEANVRLLWTAGWDSTFRLLVALVLRRKSVQPYYLIDPERPSTPDELHAMQRITAKIAEKYPDTAGLLRSPVIARVTDLRPDRDVTDRFIRLRSRSHLGGQYDWLARFARQQGLGDLELAVHRDDRAHRFLEPYVVLDDNGGDPFHRLRDKPADPDMRLFERFRFPVFELTKREMQRRAREAGFDEVMELTWFCHIPTADGKPCGNCAPCRYTIDEGLGRRIPLRGRLRYHRKKLVQTLKRPVRAAAKWAGLKS